MLEIKSEWQTFGDESVFVIFMGKDGKLFNTAMTAKSFNDPFTAKECLQGMMHALIVKVYPELKDPLFIAKRDLAQLEKRKKALCLEIKVLEEVRK